MSDLEKKTNGVEAISDDELDAVAGGNRIFANKKEEQKAREEAAADGRKYMIRQMNWICICSHKYKFAREHIEEGFGKKEIFRDIKCYNCGATIGEMTWNDF